MPIRTIKKYPNRRLYDMTRGVYITLADIKQLVLDEISFKVIDAKTKKDLTQSTLLQVISEQEATQTPLFSVSLLQDFIKLYEQKSQSSFTKYLEKTMALFNSQRTLIGTQLEAFNKMMKDYFEKF